MYRVDRVLRLAHPVPDLSHIPVIYHREDYR
jgi:hypothetical protein